MPSFFPSASVACLLCLAASACVSTDSAPFQPAEPQGAAVRVDDADMKVIGRKIWQNECAGTVEGLTSWNAGEDFPSLGIGHFIWYVPGRRGPFEESFPPLVAYMQQRGVTVPAWIAAAKGSPWKSRDEFLREQQSPRMKELRKLLADTVPVQTAFIVRRLEQSLPTMERATPDGADRDRLRANFHRLGASRNGLYAMIDYVNFKGEGIKPEERYQGQGWGLRDVLLEMGDGQGPASAPAEFADAAKRVLQRRVRNSPPERGESRWLAGWMNRCETYRRGI